MSAVTDAVKSVTGTLLGGNTTETGAYMTPSSDDTSYLNGIKGNLASGLTTQQGNQSNNQSQLSDVQSQFYNDLSSFLAGSNGPNPTPDQIKQATDFVDQTYTNPTQNALNQYQSDFTDKSNAQAAAMGRNPNNDIATQQAIYGEGQRNTINLQANRASQIAQQAQNLNNTGYSRNLSTLNAGLQGSNFLNGLTQQAFGNQLSLLNGQTGLAQMGQNQNKVGQYGTSSGLIPNMTSLTNSVGNFYNSSPYASSIGSSLMGMGGGDSGGALDLPAQQGATGGIGQGGHQVQ